MFWWTVFIWVLASNLSWSFSVWYFYDVLLYPEDWVCALLSHESFCMQWIVCQRCSPPVTCRSQERSTSFLQTGTRLGGYINGTKETICVDLKWKPAVQVVPVMTLIEDDALLVLITRGQWFLTNWNNFWITISLEIKSSNCFYCTSRTFNYHLHLKSDHVLLIFVCSFEKTWISLNETLTQFWINIYTCLTWISLT